MSKKLLKSEDTLEVEARAACNKQNWPLAAEKYQAAASAYKKLIDNFETLKNFEPLKKEVLYIRARPAFESMQVAKDKEGFLA